MARKDQVVGGELERPEEIWGYHSGQIVQCHPIVLCLGYHFAEELDYEDEDVSIDGWQPGADVSQHIDFGALRSLLVERHVSEAPVEIEGTEGLAHVLEDLLQEVGYHMGLFFEVSEIGIVPHRYVSLELVNLI